jgi:hypothetical protein
MANLERWKIPDRLTIYQIALLLEGYDPGDFLDQTFNQWDWAVRSETSAVLTALRHAIEDNSLPLYKLVRENDFGETIDFDSSLVEVSQLRKWLDRKGIRGGFFATPASKPDIVENFFSPYYAPKLAAANAAWKAVTTDPKRRRGKSPKQALTQWLTEHASEYDLLNKDGTPNATGIEEVAKVANWRLSGGAPRTPRVEEKSMVGFSETKGKVMQDTGEAFSISPLDDDIPF